MFKTLKHSAVVLSMYSIMYVTHLRIVRTQLVLWVSRNDEWEFLSLTSIKFRKEAKISENIPRVSQMR